MKKEQKAPLLDREALRAYLEKQQLSPVKAAQEGRFILPVPDFHDGKGPILLPNVKELEAKMRGSDGTVETLELEAGPQKIPADGTNVIIINRVDEFVQGALKAKLEYLMDSANGELTRGVLNEFIGYARGYTYDGDTGEVKFCRNAGFRNDVYNMSCAELKQRYVRHNRQDLSLDGVKNENIRPGYYVKKPLESMAAYISGPFRVETSKESGASMQEFTKGALVNVPADPNLPISFVHVTDINTCYTQRNGWPIVDSEGHHQLATVDAAKLPKKKEPAVRQHFAKQHKR